SKAVLTLTLRGQERFQTSCNQGVPADTFLLRQGRAAIEQRLIQAHGDRFFAWLVFGLALFGLGALPPGLHARSQWSSLIGHELLIEFLRGFPKFVRRHFPVRLRGLFAVHRRFLRRWWRFSRSVRGRECITKSVSSGSST